MFAKSKETSCAPHIGRPLWLVARVLRSPLPWNNTYRAWLLKTPSTDNQESHCFHGNCWDTIVLHRYLSNLPDFTEPWMDGVFSTK